MKIKEACEDFLVDEIPLIDLYQEEAAQHQVYRLKKTNYTTQRALTHIARALKIPQKYISYAGTKDKNAITTQYITIAGAKRDRVDRLELKDLELTFVGYRKDRLMLGDLTGNKFSLLVKEVDFVKGVPSTFYVPNYFDEQRFSSHNVQLGRFLLKKQYKEAVELIMEVDDDFKEVFSTHLNKQTNDYIGALRILPRRTLLFYVHAVQSFIFNQALKEKIQLLGDVKKVAYSEGTFVFPLEVLQRVVQDQGELMGFESQEDYEGIEPFDFINKSLPELALEGGSRPLYSKVEECVLSQEESGVRVEFTLLKGSYATIVLKQLFLAN